MATAAENYILNLMDASGGPGFESTADVFNRINPNTFRNPVFTDLKTIGPLFDEQGQFTEEFMDLKPKGFGKSQDDVLENILNNIDRFGVDVNPLQKLILQEQLKRAQEGQKISRLDLTPLELKMGLVKPVQSGVAGLPEFQLANLNFGQPTYTDTGIVSVFPTQVSTPDLATQIRQEQAVASQRAQNAAKAQESRNQSRDDYTGGGGTVVIGKGGGQTKTVSPRSREAMYSAPTRRSSPPPFRRFNDGGIVTLFGRF